MLIEDLAPLCSEKWLTSKHMDLFGTVLNDKLQLVGIITVLVIPTNILEKIVRLYHYSQETYQEEKSAVHIKKLGKALASGL